MRYSWKTNAWALSLGALLAVFGAGPAWAQQVIKLDFDSDPEELGVEFLGTAEWIEDGGIKDTGYLKITDAEGGQSGAIIFPDLSDPPGTKLDSFKITAELRVGGGTDRPADGFSFNLVRPEDPLADGQLTYAGIGSEGSLPEEGSRTGLGIGFDEWQSGPAAGDAVNEAPNVKDLTCGSWNADPSNPLDCVGISIRADGVLLAQAPFPVLNGELNDRASLQTGPNTDGVFDIGWATLEITLTPDLVDESQSNITIKYKNRTVFNDTIAYRTHAGQLVFGGRTGGAWANHHIDEVAIITDFTRIDPLGDFNEDGTVDAADFQILASNFNTTRDGDPLDVYKQGDIDFNQKVDIADFAIFRGEFEKQAVAGAAAVPEPGSVTLLMLALGGLGIIRRRRR